MMNFKTCTLLFLIKDDQTLLAMKKRGFGEGRWNGIGGKVKLNETIESALVRESKEEIDVVPTEYKQVAKIYFDQYFKGEHTLMEVNVFTSTKWHGEPKESEEMKPKWFPLDSLPYNAMWQDDPYWLPRVLAGDKIQASFIMDKEDNIVEHSIQEVKTF